MKINKILLFFVLLSSLMVFSGCWNYKEVNQLAIASGAAIDKHEDGSLHLTIEVVNIAGGGTVSYEPKYIESDGKTLFEAARKAITKEGKRIYWSHAKVVIISQEIAKEDITGNLDFLFRDAETREDSWLLVSTEKTAEEILRSKGVLNPIVAFQLDETMRSQKSISRFPFIELFEFFDRLFYGKVSPILPTVHLFTQDGEPTPQVEGTAVIKDKKMVGVLDVEHTKCMLWLRDEVKGGLVIIENAAGTGDDVTFEIFNSKSKITPTLQDGVIKMKVDINLDVGIGEIVGTTDFMSSTGRKKLIKAAKKHIEKDIEDTYLFIRDEYKADVFGFGRRIEMKLPAVWNQIKAEWDKFFTELELDVNVNIKIRGSATTRVPLK